MGDVGVGRGGLGVGGGGCAYVGGGDVVVELIAETDGVVVVVVLAGAGLVGVAGVEGGGLGIDGVAAPDAVASAGPAGAGGAAGSTRAAGAAGACGGAAAAENSREDRCDEEGGKKDPGTGGRLLARGRGQGRSPVWRSQGPKVRGNFRFNATVDARMREEITTLTVIFADAGWSVRRLIF